MVHVASGIIAKLLKTVNGRSSSTRAAGVAVYLTSTGGLGSTVIDPKEFYRTALLSNASGCIRVHHHSSGDPSLVSGVRSSAQNRGGRCAVLARRDDEE